MSDDLKFAPTRDQGRYKVEFSTLFLLPQDVDNSHALNMQ